MWQEFASHDEDMRKLEEEGIALDDPDEEAQRRIESLDALHSKRQREAVADLISPRVTGDVFDKTANLFAGVAQRCLQAASGEDKSQSKPSPVVPAPAAHAETIPEAPPLTDRPDGERKPETSLKSALDLVTLDQAAVMIHRSKRTLERFKTKGTLPSPIVAGGGTPTWTSTGWKT